jgi:tagaturonate reductase
MAFPILQFGTSRFLQAHVDLFVARGFVDGPGTRRIAVVQTTASAESARRVAFFDSGRPYRVNVRGLVHGARFDEWQEVDSIGRAVDANRDWAAVSELFLNARWIVSNTGDRGFELNPADAPDKGVPVGFPAKLVKLLHARFVAGRPAPTLFPCELIEGNGDRLRGLALEVAERWGLPEAFRRWLDEDCMWVNSLVDRIVSTPLEPAGAVAEPYALWAVENRPGLVMPCRHPDVVVTDDLKRYERLKLFILNLGHTYLAGLWSARGAVAGVTVRELLGDRTVLADLNDLYDKEVLPVFDAIGLGAEARTYRTSVLERFRNPFLDHYLADIFTNHAAKTQRRFGGLIALGERAGASLAQPRLRAALAA